MNDGLKIYFARSIRGNPDSEEYQQALSRYDELINHLKNYGQVLTEHFSNKDLSSEDKLPDKKIHDRDADWLNKADCIVAEVSVASHGVGYEIGRWGDGGLKILCLHQKSAPKLSAMIVGSDVVDSIVEYETIEQAFEGIDVFINEYFLKE
ncbi:MAG: nucleoside 2-deoxyribosyltransferase [Candidatus Heimdallarchaeaceae archaeon]|jgi:hypothetical protein